MQVRRTFARCRPPGNGQPDCYLLPDTATTSPHKFTRGFGYIDTFYAIM